MRVRLLIALTVVGFASPWLMVANQMQQAVLLEATAATSMQSNAQNQE